MAISTGSKAASSLSKPLRLQADFRAKRAVRPKVSVIIPTLNEAKNLPHVLPKVPLWVEEIIIVDGNSKDGTPEVAMSLHAKVRVVQDSRKGKGNALRRGFYEARGDIIVMLDADGSTLPSEIGRFVRELRDGADFVKGSRFLQGAGTSDMGWLRWAGNAGLTLLVKMLFGGQYSDLCYGYNAFWKDVLPLLELDATGFEIETMMNVRALQAGLRVVEVHSFESERIHGESNLRTFPDGWRVLKTIMRERFSGRTKKLPKANVAHTEIEL
jgi:glycosyltransferase involved in cell wall biosynthesis